jgi:tetratricopeptide (TPR) repeat protein
MHLEFNIGGNLHYRLFQNNGIHVWKRPIHERLHDSFNESGAERKYIDIPVELERILSMEELVEKEEYYTSLLLKQIKRDPNDIDTLFELARSHHIMRRFKEAVDYWERYYDLAMPHPIIHQVTVYYYCEDLIYSGNLPKGKEIIKKARELYPKNCLFLFLEANLFESEGKTADAIQCFKHIPELIEEEDTETTFTDPLAMQQTAKRRLEFLGGCS